MLKLSGMELAGFKSFYQRTKISFPDGITAVVGPNGCGKSNISDGIAWVLGEQSSRSLRGTKMQDVIFNGSAKRGPLPMAEVSLTLTWRGAGPAPDGNGTQPSPATDGHNGNGDGAHDVSAAERERLGGNGEESGEHGTVVAGVPVRVRPDDDDEMADASPDGQMPDAAVDPRPEDNGAGLTDGEGAAHGSMRSRSVFRLPITDGDSVTVMRRLYRNGDSEYRIGDTRCRLRDVQDLLIEARIGARTYAVIEQDRIHELLTARSKERKELIEEAAGILGFKARERSALLKLEATETNLSRLRDVISEVKRQVNSLKRQASRARRFRRNAEEIRKRRRILFHREHAELSRLLSQLSAERDALHESFSATEASFAHEEAVVEALRQRIDEEGRGAGERRDRLHEQQREMDRFESRLGALREHITEAETAAAQREEEAADLTRRGTLAADEAKQTTEKCDTAVERLAEAQRGLDRLNHQYTDLLGAADEASRQAEADRDRVLAAVARVGDAKNRATQLEERRERLGHQRARLDGEVNECREDTDKVEAEVSAARSRLEAAAIHLQEREQQHEAAADIRRECEVALDNARQRLSAGRRELHALEERQSALQAVWRPDPEVAPAPGEAAGVGVEVHPEWERAAGLGLEGLVQARVIDDLETAIAAVEAARDGSHGRVRVICPDLVATVDAAGSTRLSGRLTGARSGLMAAAAGDPELVEDLHTAVTRWRGTPGRTYLARTGEGISAQGVLTGGGAGDEAALLACNRQRREAEEKAVGCAAALPALEEAEGAALAAFEAAEVRLEQQRAAREQGAQAALEARLLHDRFAQERERLQRRLAVLADEGIVLTEEEAGVADEIAASGLELDRVGAVRETLAASGETSRNRLDGLRRRIESLALERGECQSTCAAQREALRALEATRERLHREAGEFESRSVRRGEEVVALRERAARHAEERHELTQKREQLARDLTTWVERCRADEMTQQGSRAALVEAESVARQARQRVDAARQALQDKELERTRSTADLAHLEKECQEQFDCAPDALDGDLDQEEKASPVEQVRSEMVRLEQIRERIGPVNMMAIEQCTEVEEREVFLLAQQEDLVASVRSLNVTLEKIRRISRERFLQALEEIRVEFHRIFTRLFSGGRADIVLQDPDDVLGSGIDIIAQPAGKRTQNINLLSGGEKALSAIALLFAIFNYRPSPFCLLDEVDAPLDESNVERFTSLLGEFGKETQFILITHNRRSMAIANAMYGVTMSEPGVSQTVSMQID